VANVGHWIFERNGNAVASLLFAIAGLVALGIILGPIAIGLGLMARRDIAANEKPGIRLAWAGIFIGVVAFVLPILYLL
jgi:hypothetical protein